MAAFNHRISYDIESLIDKTRKMLTAIENRYVTSSYRDLFKNPETYATTPNDHIMYSTIIQTHIDELMTNIKNVEYIIDVLKGENELQMENRLMTIDSIGSIIGKCFTTINELIENNGGNLNSINLTEVINKMEQVLSKLNEKKEFLESAIMKINNVHLNKGLKHLAATSTKQIAKMRGEHSGVSGVLGDVPGILEDAKNPPPSVSPIIRKGGRKRTGVKRKKINKSIRK